MGSAILFTAARMQEIEDGTVTSGLVDISGNLILTKHDGTAVNAGHVVGTDGVDGINGTDGAPGAPGADGEPGIPGPLLLGAAYPWPVDTIPSWALELNGQAVSRDTYSGLFALWGTTFGSGDGSTTFNVPDWTGHVPVGYDSGDSDFGTMGVLVGTKTHTLTLNEIPGAVVQQGAITGGNLGTTGNYNRISNQSAGAGDDPHNNIQPSVVVKWIVCAATSSGDFDTEVQTALVNRVGVAEADIDLLETTTWQPVIPTGVSSSGSTATINSTTGVITVPAGCTGVRVDGVFAAGYEYMIYCREVDAFTAYTNRMRFRFAQGATVLQPNSYNMGARWSQYDGTNGILNASGAQFLPIGYGYTAGGRVDRELHIMYPGEAENTLVRFWTWTNGAAREAAGTGNLGSTDIVDGFWLSPETGSFGGTLRIYRRRAMV